LMSAASVYLTPPVRLTITSPGREANASYAVKGHRFSLAGQRPST
jgi:hypothetical protein